MYLQQIGSYWDTRAEGYSISIHEELRNQSGEYYREVLSKVCTEGKGKALDIGCGPGFFSILLNELGQDVTSFDYSTDMLKNAADNLREFGYEPHIMQGDAQKLPFEDETFDIIVSRNLVWNLERPEDAYKEWMRVLKKGGRLLVCDGNHYLYYFDEDYKAYRDYRRANFDSHKCYGVDPKPIDDIAKHLPLSKERRPEWDARLLNSLGINNLNIDRRTITFEDKELVTNFVILGEK